MRWTWGERLRLRGAPAGLGRVGGRAWLDGAEVLAGRGWAEAWPHDGRRATGEMGRRDAGGRQAAIELRCR